MVVVVVVQVSLQMFRNIGGGHCGGRWRVVCIERFVGLCGLRG